MRAARLAAPGLFLFLFTFPDSRASAQTAPLCDVECAPNTSSSTYAGTFLARSQPRNTRGKSTIFAPPAIRPAVTASAEVAEIVGSESYNYAVPTVSLPGRNGLDVNLTLHYNSAVWTIDGANGTATFNADRDFPSYGLRLGYGYVQMRDGKAFSTWVLGACLRLTLAFPSATCVPRVAQDAVTTDDATLELRLQASKEQYQVGDAITLRLELRNQAKRAIKVGFALQGDAGDNLSVRLEIKDANGKKLPLGARFDLSPYGKQRRDLLVVLGPQHFYGWEILLTSYEYPFLNNPGNYSVQAFYDYHPTNNEVRERVHGQSDVKEGTPSIFYGHLRSKPTSFKITPRG